MNWSKLDIDNHRQDAGGLDHPDLLGVNVSLSPMPSASPLPRLAIARTFRQDAVHLGVKP